MSLLKHVVSWLVAASLLVMLVPVAIAHPQDRYHPHDCVRSHAHGDDDDDDDDEDYDDEHHSHHHDCSRHHHHHSSVLRVIKRVVYHVEEVVDTVEDVVDIVDD